MYKTNEEKQARIDELCEEIFLDHTLYPSIDEEQLNLMFDGVLPSGLQPVPLLLLIGFDDIESLMESILFDFKQEAGSDMTGEQAFDLLKQAMKDGKLGTAFLLIRAIFHYELLKASIENTPKWDEVARLEKEILRKR